MSLAEIKATARRALHEAMARPASFYDRDGNLLADPITARRHEESKLAGDLAGTNLSYAETHERPTEVVFLNEQLTSTTLRRGCLVIFEADEGFFVETVKPRDGITTTAEVSPMSAADLLGKTLPDGTVIA